MSPQGVPGSVAALRDGKDNVIWGVELDEPAEGVAVK
jgi:hypothetical protein